MAIPDPIRKLLVLDTNYTLEGIRERQIEQSVTCRDLGGFFAHVWSVHPFATLVTSDGWGPRSGRPDSIALAPRHTIIEGKVGRFAWLEWAFPLNFFLGQVDLFVRLWFLIRRERISAIRAASPLYVGLFGWALARVSGIPLVVRVGANHDKFFETTGRPVEPRLMRNRKVEKRVEHFVLSRADLVAAANQDNLNFALANGARPGRSTLFRYGNLVDRRHFVPVSERQINHRALAALRVEPEHFLLYVGRLEPIKQADHVIDVLAAVRARGFDVKAVLAGEGTTRPALLDHAAQLGVAHAVIFAGNLGQQLLSQLFATAAVVVSPHTGRALTEAALGEAAVAGYDVDWQAELIETGVTGILVRHGDVDALADAVAKLLSDPALRRSLGATLRLRALQMFDPEALNEHERSEYRKLLIQR